MNRKFALLLIPILLIPLASFAYAHFSDEVYKKYKIHVGSVFLNVTYFHVDLVKMPDVDNDGVIFGDELNITIYEADDCRWYVLIEANPITGGFILNTTMKMHNGGKLPFELDWKVLWDGNLSGPAGPPITEDPCFKPPGPIDDVDHSIATLPGVLDPRDGPWSWQMRVFKENETDTSGPYAPTQTHYKPCNNITVKQHINFRQPDPANPYSVNWQKDWQCKWIRIWILFEAQDVKQTWKSWTWENGAVTSTGWRVPQG